MKLPIRKSEFQRKVERDLYVECDTEWLDESCIFTYGDTGCDTPKHNNMLLNTIKGKEKPIQLSSDIVVHDKGLVELLRDEADMVNQRIWAEEKPEVYQRFLEGSDIDISELDLEYCQVHGPYRCTENRQVAHLHIEKDCYDLNECYPIVRKIMRFYRGKY